MTAITPSATAITVLIAAGPASFTLEASSTSLALGRSLSATLQALVVDRACATPTDELSFVTCPAGTGMLGLGASVGGAVGALADAC